MIVTSVVNIGIAASPTAVHAASAAAYPQQAPSGPIALHAMFDDLHAKSTTHLGSTTVSRQSEGSGRGAAFSHELTFNLWLWDSATYSPLSMDGALSTAPATNIHVDLEVQATGPIALARAYDMDPQESIDDLQIVNGGMLVPLTGTPPTYRITISQNVPRGDPSTEVIVRLPKEAVGVGDDATWEQARLVVMAVTAADPGVADPVNRGWHTQRVLLENSTSLATNPPIYWVVDCINTLNCNPSSCASLDIIDFTTDPFLCQANHTTPETTLNPIANCPGTAGSSGVGSGHCQMSTKYLAEGAPGTMIYNSEYHGFRFKDVDRQSAHLTVCGCSVISDDLEEIYLELEITGDATPAPNRNGYDPDINDYVLWYRNGPVTIRELTVSGTSPPYYATVEVRKGDISVTMPPELVCLADYIPPGFGIYIATGGDDNTHDPTNGLETAIFRVTQMWYGAPDPPPAAGATAIPNPVGWNNIARYVIEDGTPHP